MSRYCVNCDRHVTNACWSPACQMPDLPWTDDKFPPEPTLEPQTVEQLQRYKLRIDRNDCPKVGCDKGGPYVKLSDVRKLVEKLTGKPA